MGQRRRLGLAYADSLARRGALFDVRSPPDVDRQNSLCVQAALPQTGRKYRRGGCLTLRGAYDGPVFDDRNREHCWRGRRYRDWRSGCCFLDVDDRNRWHGHKVF